MNRGRAGRRLASTAAAVLLAFAASGAAFGQSSSDTSATSPGTSTAGSGTSQDDIDNLFGGGGTGSSPGTDATSGTSGGGGASTAPAVRPDDLTRDQRIHYSSSLEIYGLLGAGWARIPGASDPGGLGGEGSGSFKASLGVDLRPAPELRLSGTLSYSFPQVGSQLSELIIDYSVRNAVFFRLGIFDYTWGLSQFFQFSNLPARGLPGWGIANEPLWQQANIITQTPQEVLPVSGKVDIPIGFSNLELLARFDLSHYGFPEPNTPDPKYAGFGLRYDLVTGPIEWNLAGFYQYQLNPRAWIGMKTSLFGFDFSLESTLAFPVSVSEDGLTWRPTAGGGIPLGGDVRMYPTVVAGVSREWTDAKIKIYAEYAFNGERDLGVSWLADATGPAGHNSAFVFRLGSLGNSGFSLNAVWQHNWSDGSGLVSPLLEFSPASLATLQFGPVFVYGPDNSEVINNRLVPGEKRMEFVVLLKVTQSFRQ